MKFLNRMLKKKKGRFQTTSNLDLLVKDLDGTELIFSTIMVRMIFEYWKPLINTWQAKFDQGFLMFLVLLSKMVFYCGNGQNSIA